MFGLVGVGDKDQACRAGGHSEIACVTDYSGSPHRGQYLSHLMFCCMIFLVTAT